MPPAPICAVIRYGPSCVPGTSIAWRTIAVVRWPLAEERRASSGNPLAKTVRSVGMRAREIVAALYLVTVPVFAAGPNLVVNGGFEQNGGPGTNNLTGWTVANQAGGSGNWYAQTGQA